MAYPFLLYTSGFRTQNRIFFFQCIIAAFIALFVFMIGRKIKNDKCGLVSALIYIMWPAQLLYTSVITEEHVAALLLVIIVYLVFCINDQLEKIKAVISDSTKRVVIYSIITGVLAGAISFFKDWGIVVIVAIFISAIWLLVHFHTAMQRITLIIAILLVILLRQGTVSLGLSCCEHILGVKAGNNVIVSQMYGTLDPNSTGECNDEANKDYAERLKKNDYDYSKTNKEVLSILGAKIAANREKMPELLLNKGSTAYTDDASMLFWAMIVGNGGEDGEYYPVYRSWIQIIWRISELFYVDLVICIIAGIFLNRDKSKSSYY